MEITGCQVRNNGWILIPPSETPAGDVLTVEPCVAIDLAQLTMNFDRRCALCILKLYHGLHFTVGECLNKSLHLQPLQRCYCGNSGNPASACLMRRQCSYQVHAVALSNKWFNICGTSGKLTLWSPLVLAVFWGSPYCFLYSKIFYLVCDMF